LKDSLKNIQKKNSMTKDTIEKIFEKEILANNIHNLFITCRLAMIAIPCFTILDFYMYPQYLSILFTIRLVMTFPFIVVFFTIKKSAFLQKHIDQVSTFLFLDAGFGISLMIHLTEGYLSPYYGGLVLVVLVLCVTLTLPLKKTILISVLIYASYIIPIFIKGDISNIPYFLNNNFFLIAMVVFAIFGAYSKEISQYNTFKSRYEIQKSNEELSKVTRELEASNKKLRELDQIKMRFFANVSHELRTPLTLILGPLEQLLQGRHDMDPVPMLRAMEANAHRLLRQVNTILNFAKADVGKLTCHYKDGNLGEILSELFQASLPYSKQKNIEMTISGTDEIPDTALDVEKVETIAANLISNALKFTSDKGKITICAGSDKQIIWFEVHDTGIGIPEDKIDNIFERFHQVDDQHSRNNEGTGLGLAMVRELTLLHGGKVDVRSKIGKGSVFRVELPIKPSSPESDRRKSVGRRKIDKIVEERLGALIGKEAPPKSKVDKKTLFADMARGSGLDGSIVMGYKEKKKSAPPDAQKILVVEDNPDLRAFIVSNLFETYLVEQAENGRTGLELARRMNPDLIVSDVMMPVMDGYELCREIRNDLFLSKVPIILVTAKSGGEAVEAGLEIGATDYVPKPFEMRELRARIATHLKNRFLEKNINERETRLTAIGQMTSAVVHDLKNPLNTIMGFTQIAKQDSEVLEEKSISQNLSYVMESGVRLNRMIAEILDFAKGYAPRLNSEPVLLVPFLETTLSVHKERLSQLGISLFTRHIECDNVQVRLDSDQMHRVIENLIMNSKDAFFNSNKEIQEKIIRVETQCDKNRAMIRFSDNGPGIPDEIKTSIFDPFTTTGKKTGVGLGLSTVRNIVSAHSGTIAVKTDVEKGGAVFELTFPVLQP
jgi:signal transduction histidine kinase